MDGTAQHLILFATGLAMGAINNLAGAAGALGLVALEAAAGLDPLHANASLRPSALVIGLTGWLGFRTRRTPVPARAWLFGLLAVPGALAGALMAITLPAWVFRAALLAILVGVLLQQLGNRGEPRSAAAPRAAGWWSYGAFVLVGVHMGFVQIAAGLLTILALTAVHSRDLVATNAAKMAVMISASAAAVAVLALSGNVVWLPALTLALGCGAGSFAASRWSVDRGHGAVRAVVLAITVAVLARLGWQLATS